MTNQRTEALTEDLINMGHHMQLNLVAEGIGCGASMQLLKVMGCDVGQGTISPDRCQQHNLLLGCKRTKATPRRKLLVNDKFQA
ncbi:EAL domain-containing protein [Hydrogenovibrio marinus]|uniref:EAL domain-containing protein n=1 Tax=Hydrogenovibrio marinus TaxID=28885 RepID=UPI00138DDBCE